MALNTFLQIIMVAHSSVARSRRHIIIFYRCFFSFLFFLSPHFLRRRKTYTRKLSHMMWLRLNPQQNVCYNDFFEVLPKTNRGQKNCTVFRAKSQTVRAVILECEEISEIKTLALSSDHSTILTPNLVGVG